MLYFIPFYGQIIFHCVYLAYLICPLIHRRTFGWSPLFGCYKRSRASFLRTFALMSLECITGRGLAGSHGDPLFSLLRKCQMVFPKWPHHYAFPPAAPKAPTSPCPRRRAPSGIFVVDIPVSAQWPLLSVLIPASLMTHDVERLPMCLLVIYIFPLQECPFWSLAHFLMGYLFWVISLLIIQS